MEVSRLDEATKKLKFADYLMQQSGDGYNSAIAKHLVQTANLAVSELLALEGTSIAPQLVQKRLAEGPQEEKDFSSFYLTLWKLAANPRASKPDITNALRKVKKFLDYVKETRLKLL
jgi:hypothetical protein